MLKNTLTFVLFSLLGLTGQSVTAQSLTLEEYFIHYCRVVPDDCRYYPGSRPGRYLPEVVLRRDVSSELPSQDRRIETAASFLEGESAPASLLYIFAEGGGSADVTQCSPIPIPTPLTTIGATTVRQTTWIEGGGGCANVGTSPEIRGTWEFQDTFKFNGPLRRQASDGSFYDAASVTQTRNGQPWLTLFWGYKLGLVESQFDWDAAALSALPEFKNWLRYAPKSEEIMLLKLPPPIVEGEVTEYVNTENFPNDPGGHYYYASNDETRAILDSGRPGKWFRTGKGFKHGGYISVCRFYGSVSPGPNSHFYTASDNECSVLKSIEVKPMPSNKQQFNFEGVAFYANVPIPSKAAGQPATCPTQSIPLYRAYNAAWGPSGKKNYDSNHRFSTSRADIDAVVAKGWNDEGMVMCVPA
jgi:hypothetical protein